MQIDCPNVVNVTTVHTLITKQEQYNISTYLLTTLKLSDTRKPQQMPQVVQRRNKLAKRVWQQIKLAKAQGIHYRLAKFESYMDTATDVGRQVKQNIAVKPW